MAKPQGPKVNLCGESLLSEQSLPRTPKLADSSLCRSLSAVALAKADALVAVKSVKSVANRPLCLRVLRCENFSSASLVRRSPPKADEDRIRDKTNLL